MKSQTAVGLLLTLKKSELKRLDQNPSSNEQFGFASFWLFALEFKATFDACPKHTPMCSQGLLQNSCIRGSLRPGTGQVTVSPLLCQVPEARRGQGRGCPHPQAEVPRGAFLLTAEEAESRRLLCWEHTSCWWGVQPCAQQALEISGSQISLPLFVPLSISSFDQNPWILKWLLT